MKSCAFEHLLVPYVQNELSAKERARLKEHLSSCRDCRLLLSEYKNLDAALLKLERPAAPKQLYAEYSTRLAMLFHTAPVWKRGLKMLQHFSKNVFSSGAPSWRFARALAILFIGVMIGRFFFVPSQQTMNTAESQLSLTKEDIQFIADYMVKSELLLLTIANNPASEPSETDIFLNKDIAQNLLYKSAQVQRKARELDDKVIITFLNHLELVLLELSNREEQEIRAIFQDIKEMVNEADMLQKSRRLQQRLQKTLLESA